MVVNTWNLENLLRPPSETGPTGERAYDAKLTELARVIGDLAPDVLGVQEIGGPEPLEDLVLDAVAELDLEAFYGAYRRDGWGAAAHDPQMMVALLLYAYAIGERSSRALERRCREDVAFRVISANQVPDHATIARFRVRHEAALGELFGQVLGLCSEAGLVSVGVIALDGSKIGASASDKALRSYAQIAAEILEEAGRIDAAEEDIHGPARGDELPERLAKREGRRAWLREARQRLDRERAEQAQPIPRERVDALRTVGGKGEAEGRGSGRPVLGAEPGDRWLAAEGRCSSPCSARGRLRPCDRSSPAAGRG